MNIEEKDMPPESSEDFSQLRVLVVEDDKLLRDILAMRLSKEKFHITYAIDGESALTQIKEHKPDIILLDIILPGINGFEVLKKIKEDEATKDIDVIMVSNLGQEEDVKKAKDLGAKDFFVKANFTAEEITQKLREFMATRKKG